jgi:hypothetical protein
MNAVLTKSLDSRHAKPGDEVTAKLAQDVKCDGNVVLPKNCKLIGHVREAKAKEKGEANAQSSLGVVFDHALLKSGRHRLERVATGEPGLKRHARLTDHIQQ